MPKTVQITDNQSVVQRASIRAALDLYFAADAIMKVPGARQALLQLDPIATKRLDLALALAVVEGRQNIAFSVGEDF